MRLVAILPTQVSFLGADLSKKSLVMRFFRWSAFKVGPMPPAFKAVEKVTGSLLIGNLSLLPLPTVFLRELGQLIKGH